MSGYPAGWRGPSRPDRWGRRSSQTLGLQAGEVATYPKRPHWSLHLIGPALVLAGLAIAVGSVLR